MPRQKASAPSQRRGMSLDILFYRISPVNRELNPVGRSRKQRKFARSSSIQRRICAVKSARIVVLFSASFLIFVLSLSLPLVSVHNYCENRIVAATFGVVSISVLVFLFRGQAASTARKLASGVGMTLCVLAVAVNAAFILYVTHLCRHMFDQLR